MTKMSLELGFSADQIQQRNTEIDRVAQRYGFTAVYNLDFPTTKLDLIPLTEIIQEISTIFHNISPEVVYLPFWGDVHSDHRVTFDAVLACCKWFRQSSIKKILAYETLSETEFGLFPESRAFEPSVFIDITEFIDEKIAIAQLYQGEYGEFPFPRSKEAILALAKFRGATSGCLKAEAFILLREII